MSSKLFSLVGLVAVVAIVLSIVGLRQSHSPAANEEDTLARIQRSKVLKVCYGVYPPAAIRDTKTGALSGHDIDSINAIMNAVDIKTEFLEQAWGNMVSALQSERCDVALSLFAQIPRAAAIAFSRPLYFAGEGILAKEGEIRFKSVKDIDLPGVKVAVANGESGHNYVKDHFKQATISVISVEGSDFSRIFTEVEAGRADVAIGDAVTVNSYIVSHPNTINLFPDQPTGLSPISFGVRQNDQRLLNFLNTSLNALELNGRLAEFEQKYNAHWLHEVNTYRMN